MHPLVAVLTAVHAGLVNPDDHYLFDTIHFDSPCGPVFLKTLHLNAHTVWDLDIKAQAFTCSVMLNPHDRRQKSSVRVGFDQLWLVTLSDTPKVDVGEAEENGGILCDAPDVLSK